MAPKTMRKMKNVVAWFEIPAKKLSRAKMFYETIFDIEMEDMEMDNNHEDDPVSVEEVGVGGAICEHKEFYKPSHEGTLVYISANPDLQKVLDKVAPNGGKVIQKKPSLPTSTAIWP